MVSNIYLFFVGLMWAGYVVAFRPSWKKSSIWFFDVVVLVVVRAATNRTFPVLEYPPELRTQLVFASAAYVLRTTGIPVFAAVLAALVLRTWWFGAKGAEKSGRAN